MADKQISQLISAETVNDDDLLVLQQGQVAKKLTGKKLGDYVYAAAADKIAEVNEAVAESQEAVDELEEQKNAIAQTIADMAELGTDTTLTTPGMAADAKATGDRIGELEVEALASLNQKTISDAPIASFDDGADNVPVKELIIDIESVQSGSGDPSPDNVRPITGWTGCNVYKSGADTSSPTTYSISWETEAGTVYGGKINATSGKLLVDTGVDDLSLLTWTERYTGSVNKAISASLSNAAVVLQGTGIRYIDSIAEQYTNRGQKGAISDFSDPDSLDVGFYCIAGSSTTNTSTLYLVIPVADSAAGKIKYKLYNSTTEYDLDPVVIKTLYKSNNIWAYTGNINSLIYYSMAVDNNYVIEKMRQLEGMISGVEPSGVASTNYVSGSLIISKDVLVRLTANIVSGETISTGTGGNAIETTIEAELQAIKNSIPIVAGDISYDDTETYPEYTVGSELKRLSLEEASQSEKITEVKTALDAITPKFEITTELRAYTYTINSSNKWVKSTGSAKSRGSCVKIPEHATKVIVSNASIYAFLKTYDELANNTTPDFSTGYDERIYTAGTFEYNISGDMNYIYFLAVDSSGNNVRPSSIVFLLSEPLYSTELCPYAITDLEGGGISISGSGGNTDNDNRARTTYYHKIDHNYLYLPDAKHKMMIVYYDKNFTYLGASVGWTRNIVVDKTDKDGAEYFRILFAPCNTENTEITSTFYTSQFVLATSDPNNYSASCIPESEEPEEYYQEELADTIAKVRNETTSPSLTFALVTDIHRHSANTIQNFTQTINNIRYVSKRCKLDFVMNLGDLTDGDQAQATTLARAYDCLAQFMSIGIPYIFANGNHDNNPYISSGALLFSIKQTYSAYLSGTKNVVYNENDNGTDYYLDFTELGIRLIILNANNVKVGSTYDFSTTTATFLTEALDTEYTVILGLHQSPNRDQVYDRTASTGASAIETALESFVSGGGTLIELTGHTHRDAAFISPFLNVLQGCEKYYDVAEDYIDTGSSMIGYIDNILRPGRVNKTATEDLWSVVVYKPDSKELSCIRFGAGYDRYFHVEPIAPTTVTTKLSGTITWSSSNTEIATVSSGVISGVATGRCAVLAKDTTGNYECWIVDVE